LHREVFEARAANRMRPMATPPEDFSIAADERDGVVHVTLRGELDLATAPELEELLDDRLDSGDVVIDLRGLEFMDSSGVRVLVAAHTRAGRCGNRLILVRPPRGSAVDKIIEISGLHSELNFVDDPAQAA
jgi:anti-sigma B factor antagonist